MGSQSPVSEHPKKKKKKEKKRSKSRSPKRSKRDKSETKNGKVESSSDTDDLKKKVASPRISPSPPPRSPSTDRRLSSKARSPMVRKSRSPSKKKRRSRSISPVRKRRKSPEVLDEFGRVMSYRKKETKDDRREKSTERVERERERKREPRVDIYDKREDMMRRKRLADIESKLTEVETQRTIDECVNKRVREEMAKKDSEIDAEVCRRVDDAKKILERSMKDELDSKKEEMEKEIESQEVGVVVVILMTTVECRHL